MHDNFPAWIQERIAHNWPGSGPWWQDGSDLYHRDGTVAKPSGWLAGYPHYTETTANKHLLDAKGVPAYHRT